MTALKVLREGRVRKLQQLKAETYGNVTVLASKQLALVLEQSGSQCEMYANSGSLFGPSPFLSSQAV